MTADRKPPREVLAWAVVNDARRPLADCVARTRSEAQARGGAFWGGGWKTARKYGWRVIPVRIVPAVADGG